MDYKKSLDQLIRENELDPMNLGSVPASLEEGQSVDYVICFEEVEQLATERVIDGFGDVYHRLHKLAEVCNVNTFARKATDLLDADTFDRLINNIGIFVEGIIEEVETSSIEG